MVNKIKIIPKEWKTVKLGDTFDLKQGSYIPPNEFTEQGFDIYGANGIIGKVNKYMYENRVVLISCRGANCGVVHYTNPKSWINNNSIAVLPKWNNILSHFLYYKLIHDGFEGFITGSAQPQIVVNVLANKKILIPTFEEQIKIADILSSVDEDIEKVDQEIKKTEELKRGLMAELLTKGLGHKKFKKTKLGMIPEEWEIVRLEDVAQVERGKFSNRPRNDPKFYGGDYPFIQTGDVVNSNGWIREYGQTLNEAGLAISRMFEKGTVVITIAANIGDTGILEFNSCFPDSLVGIIVKENMSNIFLEYFLRTRKDYLNSIATQSAQKNINLEKLRPLLIIKPKIEEQKQIAEILSEVDNKIENNKQSKNKLAELKKGLMQDLLSGRVRV